METTVIATVNEIDILVYKDEDLIPIKPICDILGVGFNAQYQKLKDDEDLQNVMILKRSKAKDNKYRAMVCLPIEFVFGWLFTINPKNVKKEAKELVRNYKMLCYKILFDYLTSNKLYLKMKIEQ